MNLFPPFSSSPRISTENLVSDDFPEHTAIYGPRGCVGRKRKVKEKELKGEEISNHAK